MNVTVTRKSSKLIFVTGVANPIVFLDSICRYAAPHKVGSE